MIEDEFLLQATYGIVFFGVPQAGMDISSLIAMAGDGPNRFLVESIGAHSSQVLTSQQRDFNTALGGEGDAEVFCFYETLKSRTAQKVCLGALRTLHMLTWEERDWRLGDDRPASCARHEVLGNT